jgi:hypothetical protein
MNLVSPGDVPAQWRERAAYLQQFGDPTELRGSPFLFVGRQVDGKPRYSVLEPNWRAGRESSTVGAAMPTSKVYPARSVVPAATASKSTKGAAAKPALLAGGNPQIAKADGDAPVQAYVQAQGSALPRHPRGRPARRRADGVVDPASGLHPRLGRRIHALRIPALG